MAHASGSALDPEDGLQGSVSSPGEIFEDAAMCDLFWHKVDGGMRWLEPDQRNLIVRGTIEGTSIEELSRLYACTPDAMKHRISRARRRLGSILMKHGDTEAELRSCMPRYRLRCNYRDTQESDDVN
jgi:DNA-directed RNA polymerase specialized sigma24 family protein